MNPLPPATPAPAPRRRRIWPWVLAVCLAPWALIAVMALSYITLDRDTVALRRSVMRATHADWDTKVQCSIGRLTVGLVRTGLLFVNRPEVQDARLALAAVKHASVGVYQLEGTRGDWSREQLFADTDRAMQDRGWVRLVGVVERKNEAVLVYVPDELDEDDDEIELCVAVVNDRELVVASATVAPGALAELIAKHTPEDIKRLTKRHRAKL